MDKSGESSRSNRPGSSRHHEFRSYRDPPRDERRIDVRRSHNRTHHSRSHHSRHSDDRRSHSPRDERRMDDRRSRNRTPHSRSYHSHRSHHSSERRSDSPRDESGLDDRRSHNRTSHNRSHHSSERRSHFTSNPREEVSLSNIPLPQDVDEQSVDNDDEYARCRGARSPTKSTLTFAEEEEAAAQRRIEFTKEIKKRMLAGEFDDEERLSVAQNIKEKQQQSTSSPMDVSVVTPQASKAPSHTPSSKVFKNMFSSTNVKTPEKRQQPRDIELIDLTDSKAPSTKNVRDRSFANILKMSNDLQALMTEKTEITRASLNRCYQNPPYQHFPPRWNPKNLFPEAASIDDGYNSSDNIPLPSGNGPCGVVSTQQCIALDVHCVNSTLKNMNSEQRSKILKAFIDEKTDCTMFFFIHSKEFIPGNESVLARVALQRFVMVLNNALQLYELSTIPDTFYGKNKADPDKAWHLPDKNSYDYNAPEYTEFDRAGTSKQIAEIYTEFTKAETNILLDAHLLIEHSKDLDSEDRSQYISDHSDRIFDWLKIIKHRAANNKHIHRNFINWCDLGLPLTNASDILSMMEIIFKPQMSSISESLEKEFGAEKYSPLQHERYYQAALKGLNCNDFGIEKFYCRDDNLWYTAFVGSFFNDICNIGDDQDERCKRYIQVFRHSIDATKEILQEKYGNFQHLLSDNKFWEIIIENKCQTIPRPFDLYNHLATFIYEVSKHDPNAFDYTLHLIRPFNHDFKRQMGTLASLVFENDAMNKEENLIFVEHIINDLMKHFYPVLQTFTERSSELSSEHSAAIRLFTIYVIKGFLMEWESYNRWTKEMKEGKKYDREGTGLDLAKIKDYFGTNFMELPANIMTAIWERKFHDNFFSTRVPKELRKLLIRPEFKNLSAATITNIFELLEKIDENQIDIKWFKNNDKESDIMEIDSGEFDDSFLGNNKDTSTSINMSSSPMEIDNVVADTVNGSANKSSTHFFRKDPEQTEPLISKSGLKRPSKFGGGRLSQWAFNNAEADSEKKGDKFVLAPINQQKEDTSSKPLEQNSLNDYASQIKFNHPVLKANQEKFISDFPQLYPEMQEWALHFSNVLEDYVIDKQEKQRMDPAKIKDSNCFSTYFNADNQGTIFNARSSFSNDSDLQMLSPFPLIAVCSKKVSVIYPFPLECLLSPDSQNVFERHALKQCEIWDYLEGKCTDLNGKIIAFLIDMWQKTVLYSQQRKKDNTLNDYKSAENLIKHIQNGNSVESQDFIQKVAGIRFPYDLRKHKHFKKFCTLYIDVNTLNYRQFKFHFDITMSPENFEHIPYNLSTA